MPRRVLRTMQVHERLITLACALGALLVFALLFVRAGAPGERDAAAPTSVERHGHGLLGAVTWLNGEGVHTVSLRERYGSLAKRGDLPTKGNLLVVMLPATTAFRTDEAVALDSWIRAGNTLLIMAALSDRPDWARSGRGLRGDLQLLSGLEAHSAHEQATQDGRATAVESVRKQDVRPLAQRARESLALGEPQRESLVPNRPHAYLEGVHEAIALSDYQPLDWTLQIPRDGFMLSLAHEAGSARAVLWMRPLGAGTILVSGFASLFGNRALALADNAQLFANIVAVSTAAGGAVIFDDEHQGLSASYDPSKFYRDRRLYLTLGIIAAVWLVWVLGGTRLPAAAVVDPAPQEVQLVRDTGLFLARALQPAAAARRMLENFLQNVRQLLHDCRGAGDAALWEQLGQHPRLAVGDVAQLRAWYATAHADGAVPLLRLHNLIVQTERLLSA